MFKVYLNSSLKLLKIYFKSSLKLLKIYVFNIILNNQIRDAEFFILQNTVSIKSFLLLKIVINAKKNCVKFILGKTNLGKNIICISK